MALSRRGFLVGGAGAAAAAGLASCSSTHSNGSGGGGDSSASAAATPSTGAGSTGASTGASKSTSSVKGTLNFAFWGGSTGELAGFKYAKQKFEAAHPGTTINLKVSPYDGFFNGIERGLSSGNAPDVFRVDYTTIGSYSAKHVLLDLSPYVDSTFSAQFLPALWQAVNYQGKPYGVPHQTDTTCVVYNKAAFATAGITSVPTTLASAWTWEEFSAVASKLRKTLPDKKYPFAYDWTQAGAFRWLSFLYEAGGTLLSPDLTKVNLPSAAASKAMDYTKSFFTNKWVPTTNTIKTSVYSDNFFLNQTVPMTFVGDFLVPELADPKAGYKGGAWGATFVPRDVSAADDLGGNAIVATKSTKNPELAAEFLKFLVTEDAMKYFCEQAIELPTLKTLASAPLAYTARPDVVKICAESAPAITDTVVRESTVGAFNSINTVLQDQLELAFHGQDSDKTIKQIASGVTTALKS